MRFVPLYDSDECIGSVPLVTNLDSWDGMRWRHPQAGCHLEVGRLSGGRYYACYSSDWPEGIVRRKGDDGTWEVLFRCSGDFGSPCLSVVIPEEEAKDLVRKHNERM
jgi:hypothetical protein